MTGTDVLRIVIAGTAATVSGAMVTVLATYVRAAWHGYRGSLLVRHVVLVTAGTLGLVATAGTGVYDQLPDVDIAFPAADQRLWLYLASMLLLFVAVIDVGRHTRRRGRESRPGTGG